MKSSPVLRGVLGVACAALLCGSSCRVHYSSGHHDDCDQGHGQHDDCGGDTDGAQDDGDGAWDLGAWVIREHGGLERAPETERHPIRRVVGVRDVALPRGWPRDARGFVRAAALVIEANPGLLGLPAWAGEWVVVDVARSSALIWVRFAQVWRGHDDSGVGDSGVGDSGVGEWGVELVGAPGGGGVALGFDDLGRLVEFTNTTLVYPWR